MTAPSPLRQERHGQFPTARLAILLTLGARFHYGPSVHQPDRGDLVIQTSSGALAGTILRKGPIGVVFIAGSGPNNRDGMRGTYTNFWPQGWRQRYPQVCAGRTSAASARAMAADGAGGERSAFFHLCR